MTTKTLGAAVVALLMVATSASATELWFGQLGGSGGSGDSSASYQLGFTVGEPIVGDAAAGQTSGIFGFWMLPGGVLVPTSAPDDLVPLATQIFQNYPNPIHGSTTLPYRIGGADKAGSAVPVRLDVFDVAGRRVATLVDDARAPGDYRVQWDGRDRHGRAVASGVYFARFSADNTNATVRMLRIR